MKKKKLKPGLHPCPLEQCKRLLLHLGNENVNRLTSNHVILESRNLFILSFFLIIISFKHRMKLLPLLTYMLRPRCVLTSFCIRLFVLIRNKILCKVRDATQVMKNPERIFRMFN